jgi:hypothetical protein
LGEVGGEGTFIRLRLNRKKNWVLQHVCHLRKIPSQANPGKKRDPISKIPIMVGGVAQVIECLPGKYKALSSNPGTGKNQN